MQWEQEKEKPSPFCFDELEEEKGRFGSEMSLWWVTVLTTSSRDYLCRKINPDLASVRPAAVKNGGLCEFS